MMSKGYEYVLSWENDEHTEVVLLGTLREAKRIGSLLGAAKITPRRIGSNPPETPEAA
jgi:hypothetical protein